MGVAPLKIAVMSDLHLEFENRPICDAEWNRTYALREATPGHPKQGPYLGDLVADARGVDLVVLAGDIALGADGVGYADAVARFANAPVVYVTHHAPLLEANPPEYRGGELAPAFVSDMRAEIEAWKPDLWVFGHTHHDVDLVVGKTRVVSQQRGYVGAEPGATAFRPKLVDLDDLPLDDEPTGPKI